MSSVNFKFTKTIEKKVKSVLPSVKDNEDNLDKDYVLSLENKRIKSTHINEKREYIIPLIKARDSHLDSLEVRAINEILQETQVQLQGVKTQSNLTILMEKREQMETNDTKFNSSIASNIDPNYDTVPIEEYGKALLRGMGWKKDQPIGLRNKEIVKSMEPVLRPKGMGLGAEKLIQINPDFESVKSNGEDGKKLSEDQKIKGYVVGSPVFILKGSPYNDMYGLIEGLDEDNGRVIVKLSMKNVTVTVPKYLAKPVSLQEYEKCHRYLNKGKADEMDHKSKRKLEQRSEYGLIKLNKAKEEIKVETISENGEEESRTATTWVKPCLVVRIIDPKYQLGLWYEKKVYVLRVSPDKKDPQRFSLKIKPLPDQNTLQEGKSVKLRFMTNSMLETVLPKNQSNSDEVMLVMVVKGEHTGRIGELVRKDKRTLNASVKFRDENGKRQKIELPFEFVCEYRKPTSSE